MNRTRYASNRNLILFFTITLLWTWIAGFIPVVFGMTGTALGTFIFYFGGGAPSVTALFFVFLTYPKEARRDYFRRCLTPKGFTLKWFLFVIAFFILQAVVGLFIGNKLLDIKMPGMDWLHIAASQPYMIPVLLFFSFLSGPFNEEFGWRGYSLDKLLVRFGYVRASLLLGTIWTVWHLAWYFTPGQAQYEWLQKSFFDAFLFLPETVALTFVVTFVYVNTNRNVMAGAFTHMMSNFFTSQLLSPYSVEMSTVIRYVSMAFSCAVIVYSLLSKQFKKKLAEETEHIRTDVEKFSQTAA